MIVTVKFIVDIPLEFDDRNGVHPALYSQSMEVIKTADKLGGRALFVGYKTPERFVEADKLTPIEMEGIANIENNQLITG